MNGRTLRQVLGLAGGSDARTGSRSSSLGVHRSWVPSATSLAASGMSLSSGEHFCANSGEQGSAPSHLLGGLVTGTSSPCT